MKYVIYCRKSTDTEDKQVLSLESQEGELVGLAKAQNLNVVEILHESKSAKAEGRPVFNRMLEMLAKGKVDGIVCWKLDRLARNFVDGGKIIDMLQHGTFKEIRTHDAVHLPTDNVLMIAMHFGMANQYIRDLSENVKRGNRTKLERGDWPNKSPLGYLNDKATKKIVIDPDRSKYIARAFELYRTGKYGYRDISNMLFDEGFRSRSNHKVPKSKMHYILSDTFYFGLMNAKGKLYNGNHEPIISKALYDSVQEVVQERLHPRKKTLLFPIRGLATCGTCGCMYTASRKKGHDYYYCTNGKGVCTSHKTYLRENDLYAQLLPILEKLAFDKEEVGLLYLAAKEDMHRESGYFEKTLVTLKQEETTLAERQNKLLDAFLDSSVSKEVHEEKSRLIENQKVLLQKQIAEMEQKMTKAVSTLEPTKKLFLDCITWANEFLNLPPEEKQNIAHEVLWNLSMNDKNIVSFQMKSPYSTIANLPENADLHSKLPDLDSNQDDNFQRVASYH